MDDRLADLEKKVTRLERRVERERAARQAAESIAEKRLREIFLAKEHAENLADLADAANQAKSDFLAKMTHELRTPMNGVIGITELLLETSLNSEQQDLLRVVQSSGNALVEIINDILDLSKIEAGRMMLEQEPFDLHDLVEETTVLIAALAREKPVEVVNRIAPEVPRTVVGDKVRIRQILTNLMGNAVKFTDEGEVALSITTGSEIDRGLLSFRVTDTGVGIPTTEIDRLFDSFEQADNSTTRQFGGTGLGLTICRRLVTLMGGRIEVESTVGVGSAFTAVVEVEPEPPDRSGSAAHSSPPAGTPTGTPTPSQTALIPAPSGPPDAGSSMADHHPLRVLVAEDNLVNQKVVQALLGRFGYRCTLVTDGRAAVAAVERDTFDLILMDLQMPYLGGIDATATIRALPDSVHQPHIVALTAASEPPPAEMGSLGLNGHLAKPLGLDALQRTLQNVPRAVNREPEPAPAAAAVRSGGPSTEDETR